MNPFNRPHKQLSIFVTAGFPELNSLPSQIKFLESNRVDFIEVGIPFSDPMADGPVIQASSMKAISHGFTMELLFQQLSKIDVEIPLVIMSYLNPILRFGIQRFLKECSRVGIAHVIIPDVSIEIYERDYEALFQQSGMTLCFLVTPETTEERVQRMAKRSSNGFIYLVSTTMTTGNSSPLENQSSYDKIKAYCGATPMMIGFGIRTNEDVLKAHHHADGAIIGTAYLEALSKGEALSFLQSIKLS